VPFPLLLLFTGLAAESACDLNAITFQVGATLLLAAVLAARLLLFPFGWSAVRCLPLSGPGAASYALFSLPAIALFALLKFLPYSRFLGQTALVLSALSMIVWAILCYRQSKLGNVMLYAYLAQTATVAVMIVYLMLNVGSEPGVCLLILGNHLVSSLGLLMCASVDEGKRGRFGNAALILFAFCMLGLPPSPGFFGKLMLFKTSLAAADLPAYLLRLSFLVNLFIVYCQSKYLAPVTGRIRTGPKSPRPLTVALLLLGACLFFAMVFVTQLSKYLAASGL
jgi:formate hydrogenlyase subunit 3/multisubunit Na+/H+ antiporter MnhD subunit